jgi:hypothetical protein
MLLAPLKNELNTLKDKRKVQNSQKKCAQKFDHLTIRSSRFLLVKNAMRDRHQNTKRRYCRAIHGGAEPRVTLN